MDGYPRSSQDFNAIENAWAILKERLDETVPVNLESREDFVKRLKAAVRWANKHRADQLWYLSTNQKKGLTIAWRKSRQGGAPSGDSWVFSFASDCSDQEKVKK